MYTVSCPVGVLLLLTLIESTTGSYFMCKGVTDVPGHALVGYNISTIWTSTEAHCFSACIETDCQCVSFNFHWRSKRGEKHQCQLNYETKDVVRNALKRVSGSDYHDIHTGVQDGPCSSQCKRNCCKSSNPCKNNSTCSYHCDSIRRVSCLCQEGFVGRFCEKPATSCTDYLLANNSAPSGKYTILLNGTKLIVTCIMHQNNMTAETLGLTTAENLDPDGNGPFKVIYDKETSPGDWVIFQKRIDGSENFMRTWADYKAGFGSLYGEFWLGLEYLHRLTSAGYTTLRVDLWDWEGQTAHAQYTTFNIGDEASGYKIAVNAYSGNAGNSLSYNNGASFFTTDRDNSHKCVSKRESCYWFRSCSYSNLNGIYVQGPTAPGSWKGVSWDASPGAAFRGAKYSMKRVEMKVRKP